MRARSTIRTGMAIPLDDVTAQVCHKRYTSESEIQSTRQRPKYGRSISLPELSNSVILDSSPCPASCEDFTTALAKFKGETILVKKTIRPNIKQRIPSQQILNSDGELSKSNHAPHARKIGGKHQNDEAMKSSKVGKPYACGLQNTGKMDFRKRTDQPANDQTPWKHYRRKKREHKNFNFLSVFLICFLIVSSTLLSMSPSKDRQYHVNYIPIDYKSRKKIKIFKRRCSFYCSNDPTKKMKDEVLRFLFAFSDSIVKWPQYFIVFPLNSLNSYFKSVENGVSYDDSMNYEWVRLRSFSSFRHGSLVSPISLSRWGFFYTGSDSEVKCFSCGVRYDQWSSDDDVFEIHRRISPNCRHLTGDDQRNVPIGHRNNVSPNQQSGANFISETSQLSGQQCNNGHQSGSSNTMSTSYTSSVPSGANFERQQARPPQIDHITAERNRSGSGIRNVSEQLTTSRQPYENKSTDRGSRYTHHSAPPIRSQQQSNVSGVNSATIDKLSPLGVNFDKPRYPQYAVLTVRMSTYNGWPATQIPRKMAEAGFIYAGYADYTRCFFCGGGLRNWEEGDDPWIEHARWFPRCAYVRQNKGDQFVQLVHERLQEMVQSAAEESITVVPRNEGVPTQKTAAYQEVTQHTTNDTGNRETNLKSLPCYQSVLELGYPSDTIERIIHQLIEKGLKDFTSADILEVIFKMEEEGSSTCQETTMQKSQIEEAASLMEENRRLKEQRLCMICVEKDSCVTFLPCGHLVCCEECAPAMRKCPKCQQIVQGSIKTWLV